MVRCGTKKADPFHYARYEERGKPEGLWGEEHVVQLLSAIDTFCDLVENI